MTETNEKPTTPEAPELNEATNVPETLERVTADEAGDVDFEAMLAAAVKPAMSSVPEGFRCGYVAVVGRPNVGKSTLINHLIGEKVSITSKKPQTTRDRVLGVVTKPEAQFIFVDTPGFQTKVGSQLIRRMNRTVRSTLGEVDAVVFVMESVGWRPADLEVLKLLPKDAKNVVLAINKVDLLKGRDKLLPLMAESMQKFPFAAIVPVSAEKGRQLDDLLGEVESSFPRAFPISIPTCSRTVRPGTSPRRRFAKRPSDCSATSSPTASPSRSTAGMKRTMRPKSSRPSSSSAKVTSRS